MLEIEKEKEINFKNGNLKSKVSSIVCPYCKTEYKIKIDAIPKNQTLLKVIRLVKLELSNSPVDKSNKNLNKSNPQTITSLWNGNNYLKTLFDDVDVNGDGTITKQELHDALIRGQLNFQFDIKTVELIVNKYDTNHDGEINFEEFQNLFSFINEEYSRFLSADEDGSQTIEPDELEHFIEERGYKIEKTFYNFIVESIKVKTGKGISFDYFCRIMARFDQLIDFYNFELAPAELDDDPIPLDVYLKSSFFEGFW